MKIRFVAGPNRMPASAYIRQEEFDGSITLTEVSIDPEKKTSASLAILLAEHNSKRAQKFEQAGYKLHELTQDGVAEDIDNG